MIRQERDTPYFVRSIFFALHNSYDESDIFDFKYCIVMSRDRLFIGRFTRLILRSHNIDIISQKYVLCSNEIFATHISLGYLIRILHCLREWAAGQSCIGYAIAIRQRRSWIVARCGLDSICPRTHKIPTTIIVLLYHDIVTEYFIVCEIAVG